MVWRVSVDGGYCFFCLMFGIIGLRVERSWDSDGMFKVGCLLVGLNVVNVVIELGWIFCLMFVDGENMIFYWMNGIIDLWVEGNC